MKSEWSAFGLDEYPSKTHELSMTTTTSRPVCSDQTSCTLDEEFVVPLMSSDTNMLRPSSELKWSYSGVNVSSAPIKTASAGVQSSLNLSGLMEDVVVDVGGVGKAAKAW